MYAAARVAQGSREQTARERTFTKICMVSVRDKGTKGNKGRAREVSTRMASGAHGGARSSAAPVCRPVSGLSHVVDDGRRRHRPTLGGGLRPADNTDVSESKFSF